MRALFTGAHKLSLGHNELILSSLKQDGCDFEEHHLKNMLFNEINPVCQYVIEYNHIGSFGGLNNCFMSNRRQAIYQYKSWPAVSYLTRKNAPLN